jgi:hypothetical protein
MRLKEYILTLIIPVLFILQSCGGSASDADLDGVGAECINDFDCDQETLLACISKFKGGYCSLPGCTADDDCPDGSICVTDSGENYCFLVCNNSDDCNFYRDSDSLATCSLDIVRVGTNNSACVPQHVQ